MSNDLKIAKLVVNLVYAAAVNLISLAKGRSDPRDAFRISGEFFAYADSNDLGIAQIEKLAEEDRQKELGR